MLVCLLVGVLVVSGDCGTAQQYAPHVRQLPQVHWALVATVTLRDADYASVDHAGRGIILPSRYAHFAPLAHEVGHLVFSANNAELQRRWNAELWDGNLPLGDMVAYPHKALLAGDAPRAMREDAATSYERHLAGRSVGKRRRAWIEQNIPELRAEIDGRQKRR